MLLKYELLLIENCTASAHTNPEQNKFFEDFGVWKDAPVLIGSTKYEPLPDVKNIMITGGAGFM
jgi:hypothetical protein